MRSIRLFILATALLLGSTGIVGARGVRIWSYQELLDKSELVVIAFPTATNDTKEHIDLPGFVGQRVIGVETSFTLSAVLKGDKALKEFLLHHYRTPDGANIPNVPNGPSFVSFGPAGEKPPLFQRTYILFLLREADGRYAPVVGQTDPGLGVKELVSAGTGVDKTLGKQIADVLKDCQTLKPGMIRAELSTVFTTEGGLSTTTQRTYAYRGCPHVKVDVAFALSDPKQDAERPADIITKISKPYLDWSVTD